MQRTLRRLAGIDPWHRVGSRVRVVHLGSEYGGWSIHAAGLAAESVVYSFGVGEDVSFDVELIERYGVRVHAFDPTPRVIEWVDTQNLPDGFHFHPVALGTEDGEIELFPPVNPQHVSHSIARISEGQPTRVPSRTLRSIMSDLGHDHIDLLKMDIEGSELDVVEDLAESDLRPSQVLIEFHHFSDIASKEQTDRAVETMMRIGYSIIHISDTGREYSFLW